MLEVPEPTLNSGAAVVELPVRASSYVKVVCVIRVRAPWALPTACPCRSLPLVPRGAQANDSGGRLFPCNPGRNADDPGVCAKNVRCRGNDRSERVFHTGTIELGVKQPARWGPANSVPVKSPVTTGLAQFRQTPYYAYGFDIAVKSVGEAK